MRKSGISDGAKAHVTAPATEMFELRLYIAGQTPRSVTAFANLKEICEEHLSGRYKIEVIDLLLHPQLAAGDQIDDALAIARLQAEIYSRGDSITRCASIACSAWNHVGWIHAEHGWHSNFRWQSVLCRPRPLGLNWRRFPAFGCVYPHCG